MRPIAFSLIFALAACAPPLWVKPGGSQNDFSKDKYTCMQQAQQREAGASFNRYGFSASDTVVTNEKLFASCMNSRGWYLQGQDQISAAQSAQQAKTNEAAATLEQLKKEINAICEKQGYKTIFEKTACNPPDIMLNQLSISERISKSDRPLFMEFYNEQNNINKRAVTALRSSGNTKDKNIADLFEQSSVRREQNALNLYDGTITWGQYNKARKSIAEALQEAVRAISNKQ